eukprot:1147899-Pelagomonas_calceolata.AAC.1
MSSQPIHKLLLSTGAKHTLELMLATSTELAPGGRPTGFFCFAGCPFLDAWALASLAWSPKTWVGVTGSSHLARGLELELGAWEAIFHASPFEPRIN